MSHSTEDSRPLYNESKNEGDDGIRSTRNSLLLTQCCASANGCLIFSRACVENFETRMQTSEAYGNENNVVYTDSFETYLLQSVESQFVTEELGDSYKGSNSQKCTGSDSTYVETVGYAHNEGVRFPEYRHPYTMHCELTDRIQFPAVSQYNFYSSEQSVNTFDAAGDLSGGWRDSEADIATDFRIPSDSAPDGFSLQSGFTNAVVETQVPSSKLSHDIQYEHNFNVSEAATDAYEMMGFEEPHGYLTCSGPGQQEVYSSARSFGQYETVPVLDQYRTSVYDTVDLNLSSNNHRDNPIEHCNALLVRSFHNDQPVDVFYQVACTSSSNTLPEYPVTYEPNTYEVTYADFEKSAPVVTALPGKTHSIYGTGHLELTRKNASTYNMVGHFSDQPIVPINSVVLFEPDIQVHTSKNLSEHLDTQTSEIWTHTSQNEPYTVDCNKIDHGDQQILASEVGWRFFFVFW